MSFTTSCCHNGNQLVNSKVAEVAISANDRGLRDIYNVAMNTTWLPRLHLSTWRRNKGFTQERLGNILGVGKSAISRWESGERQMNMEDIERIAKVFGIEPMALFRSPADFEKAQAINEFAKLVEEIGVERANLLLKAFKPPNE